MRKEACLIPYARQEIVQQDIDAVCAVLSSDFLTQGPAVPAFEDAVRSYCGVREAVAVNSATSALHIACLALGLKEGGLLWTSPITFVASANCGLYCGADVDFVDIDPVTWNISPEALEQKLQRAEQAGRLPDMLVAVHFTGQSCDMEPLHRLSVKYGFKIIEDASHAIGGAHRAEPIGSCRYCDVTVFSFHPVKIITSGEGGMALTNSAEIAERMRLYRSHGVTRNEACMHRRDVGGWYYEQIDLGYNYRMTDILAALGSSQMKRLDAYVDARHAVFARYQARLADLPLILPHVESFNRSAIHLYPVVLDNTRTDISRRDVYDAMHKHGVKVNVHYIPVHFQPYYQDRFGFETGSFPNAERFYAGCLSLPMYATLKEEEQDFVCFTLRDILLG